MMTSCTEGASPSRPRRAVRPALRARRLRRRLRRGHQGPTLAHDRAQALQFSSTCSTGRVRVRGEYRRWRRHPAPGARQVPPARVRPAGHRPAAGPRIRLRDGIPAGDPEQRDASAPPALDRRRGGPAPARLARGSHDDHLIGQRALGRAVHHPGAIGRGEPCEITRISAQALRDPQALREGGGRPRYSGKTFAYMRAQLEHAHLQGHAEADQIETMYPDSPTDVESALALVHQRSARTLPSWRSRTRTGTSRTTARSTRCAAT